MKRILSNILVAVLCIGMLTGCGGSQIDAGKYAQGCLDALLKAKFSEEYLKYSGNNEESAKQAYNQSIDKDLELFLSDSTDTSDELKAKYREMFVEVYKNTKYEIGKVTAKENNSYTVVVKAYRLIVFANTVDPVLDYYNGLSSKKQDKVTQEQLDTMVVDNAMKNLEEPKYDETPTEVEITVAPVDGNSAVYGISTEDYQNVYSALMDGTEWTETNEESEDGSDDSDDGTDENPDEIVIE
ncbi:MAG: hypothetical protein J5972_02540 [Eubacterium sp.]|nr:hypothetical protein [Eubacterium sp.]